MGAFDPTSESNMTRILTVLGARPQFIKAATVSRAIGQQEGVAETLVHTGQHFDANMSDVFFDELGIPAPDYHLGVAGGGHGEMTGRMLERLEELLKKEAPDWVLVYGDTNSTLAGALAAAKLHIPVAHVEAGLRSFNRRMPEEQNRILTDQLADILFTPTDTASYNLRREGVPEGRIAQVGDVMFDASLFYAERAAERSAILAEHGLNKGEYVLATVHRSENTDDRERLHAIMMGLEAAAQKQPVVFPLHPRTRAALVREGVEPRYIRLIEPVGYLDMVALESNAAVIATDSGGVQKEAYFHGVPCVTLRAETEWLELLHLGWNRLAPPETADIYGIVDKALQSSGQGGNPYGEGNASAQIVEALSYP